MSLCKMKQNSCASSCRVRLVGGFIHQAVKLAAVGDLQFEKPCLAARIGIDHSGLGIDRIVDFEHFAGNRCVDVGGGFDRFDHGGGFRLLQVAADLRQFDENDVAELGMRGVGPPGGGEVALG